MSGGWAARYGALVAMALIVGGCAGSGAVSSPPPTRSATPPAVVASRPPLPSVSSDPIVASPVGPPAARMRADGGDPVPGQLGTYTWGESGSDAPFLRGNPMTVGAGEPLTVELHGPAAVGAWRARVVAAGADPGDGRALAVGTATPTFDAPTVGTWTVELIVTFTDPVGSASYFWEVTAR